MASSRKGVAEFLDRISKEVGQGKYIKIDRQSVGIVSLWRRKRNTEKEFKKPRTGVLVGKRPIYVAGVREG
jgi:hypothetical protein